MINMNETRLTTIAQLEEFLSASSAIEFKPGGADVDGTRRRRQGCPRPGRGASVDLPTLLPVVA